MSLFEQQNAEFQGRHIGPTADEVQQMLSTIGVDSLESLIGKTIPQSIRMQDSLDLPGPVSEYDYLKRIKEVSLDNKVFKTYIGQGYYNTIVPSVILRNVFENPGWYTQYTPYQAEISQGRLESLLNYQTMISDLTGLPIANASLLDEATAAAEAMAMFFSTLNKNASNITRPKFFVDNYIFPQTKDVLVTRALPIGIELVFGDYQSAEIDQTYFGAIVQYPNSQGSVEDYAAFIHKVHDAGAYVVMATDLLALTLLKSPGELGADAACGSAQRFGVPLGFGGPHAAFFTVKDEFKRTIPGRIIGISVDSQGNKALRMALQTREQHIKREKATSNICTAQALLANMAAMYAVFHGPKGLKAIADRVNVLADSLADALQTLGAELINKSFFDTLTVKVNNKEAVLAAAGAAGINFRITKEGYIGISLDETTSPKDILDIVAVFNTTDNTAAGITVANEATYENIPVSLHRNSPYLTHPVFNTHHSETQMMRYMKKLENKDLSLNTSMISLGSCTMKLNAATEMMPLSWSHWSSIHPFAPKTQVAGYHQMIDELSRYLCAITAFDACSLQPNSGAQGEYAGLLTIRNYFNARGESHRTVMLIPISAHGTNPASAVMAGMKVVVVKALENGYIDVDDLKAKAEQYKDNLAGIMITYPSTYGIFEESVKDITQIIHQYGGQVYMDGANMNAQVGLTAPGLIGADVCHLNLHKTFAIPHGGGGPGMGPICVKAHLAPYLPSHIEEDNSSKEAYDAVSAAPFGSASILLISHAYISMLGGEGVKNATQYAILNANYMRARLEKEFDILYLGNNGTCAHEFIVDLRPFKKTAEIEAEDVAKRLMDYGFHAPTMSFPVPGTIMIEPTESENKAELDRFCDALLSIREEIRAIENNQMDKADNPLKNAPHTQFMITATDWAHAYTREQAAYPLEFIKENKFWPSVGRVNNTVGDRNLICTCEPVEAYMES
ncbi:aminomethyl-transferring glycine dehydrogenase [Gynurincola endophyticus]|uniref:aminomethyl-transferring glycine dehydrogenase n=1 Tax=Gynurincola endophyticus TaxID=2479004 RepID=UPI000F8F32C3|nr:aminomethyl-transferring glycine dehydrogenase [Gynurincola endophyticus]